MLLATIASLAGPSTNLPSVTLAWDQTTDSSVNRYSVYYGTASRIYTNAVVITGKANTSCTITNLVRSTTYYFAATCIATNNLESAFSAEVVYATSPIPSYPFNLNVQTLSP